MQKLHGNVIVVLRFKASQYRSFITAALPLFQWLLAFIIQARVAFLQGERKGQENLKKDLVRRIKMLEYALKQERWALWSSCHPFPPPRIFWYYLKREIILWLPLSSCITILLFNPSSPLVFHPFTDLPFSSFPIYLYLSTCLCPLLFPVLIKTDLIWNGLGIFFPCAALPLKHSCFIFCLPIICSKKCSNNGKWLKNNPSGTWKGRT